MRDVLVPPVETRLTTLDAVRDEIEDLGIDFNDARLLRAIKRVSAALTTALTLTPLQTIAETVVAGERGQLVLLGTPIRSIISVADTYAVLPVTNYLVDNASGVLAPVGYDAPFSTYDYGYGTTYDYYGGGAYGVPYGLNPPPPDRHTVTVTYQGGWIMPGQPGRDLPDDIEDGCIQLVREVVSNSGRNPQIQTETVEGAGSLRYFDRRNYDAGENPIIAALVDAYAPVRF